MQSSATSASLAVAEVLDPAKERHGQIYTWGFCTHGQLGLRETVLGAREYVESPTHAGPGSVLRDVELKAAACGHFHTVAVDVSGNVFAFGRNDRCQLGHGGEEEDEEVALGTGYVPRRLRSLARSIVTGVTCGAFHSVARTADGALLSWGWNKHGQLGRLTAYQSDALPGPVLEAKGHTGAFRSFAAGFSHSAAVLSSGQVLAWGSNESGQLGVGSAVRHPEVATGPLPVPDVVAEEVAAGDNHTLVLALDGKVFATGDTSYGRLGIGAETPAAAKRRGGHFAIVLNLPWSEDPTQERIKAIAGGGATGAAISSHGRLFTWGGGVWGQLGQGSRTDRDTPALVPNLQRVQHVDIAQDHMMAICKAAPAVGDNDTEEGSDQDDDGNSASSSLWVWGRRQLLPTACCRSADPEAQCVPVEVPLEMLGSLGALYTKGAQVKMLATCGGSHSIVVGVPVLRTPAKAHYGAVRCPRMSTVTGPGTRAGAISQELAFRIVSRNEEGRDEKVGGLRFCVWATPISAIRPRRSMTKGEALHRWDTHPFELQRIIDGRNGTYDGSYIIRRPGTYFFHVRMLHADEEVDIHAEIAELSRLEPGEPVSGSPFKVEIDSGPAFASHCMVELRANSTRGKKRRRDEIARPDVAVGGQDEEKTSRTVFRVDASSEVVWNICSFDLFGNAVTTSTDEFSAFIKTQGSDAVAMADAQEAAADLDLADSLGLPKVRGGNSPAADAVRERVRQRKAEQIWTRMSSTFTKNLGRPASRATANVSAYHGEQAPLHVRQSKVPGCKEVRWTPDAVGRYELHVALLSRKADGTLVEEKIGGSPFEVVVSPGNPDANQSRLLVGAEAMRLPGAADEGGRESPWPLSLDDPPSVDVPIRLLLCDRVGNVCPETQTALQKVMVRIENVRLLGSEIRIEPGVLLLENTVEPQSAKSLLSLKLRASPDLLTLAARADAAGEFQDGRCVVQLFVSAYDRATRQRLLGSPSRLQLMLTSHSWSQSLPIATPALEEPLQKEEAPTEREVGLVANLVTKARFPEEEKEKEKEEKDVETFSPVIHEPTQTAAPKEATVLCNDAAIGPPSETPVIVDQHSELRDDAVDGNTEVLLPAYLPIAEGMEIIAAKEGEHVDELDVRLANPADIPRLDLKSIGATPSQSCGRDSDAKQESALYCTDTRAANVVSAAASIMADSVNAICVGRREEDEHLVSEVPQLADAAADVSAIQLPKTRSRSHSRPASPVAPPRTPVVAALPSPTIGYSCPVRTPPTVDEELAERRTLAVQLPPLSPASSSSVGKAPSGSSMKRSSSSGPPAAELPEQIVLASPSRVRGATVSKGKKPRESGRAMSFMPASALAAPERKAGNQTNVQPAGRRRAPALSAGLVRAGPLTLAPSPWPQAR